MYQKTAIQLAIAALIKEKRHYKQFHDMFKDGFLNERPGYAKYLELGEAIRVLCGMIEGCDRPSSAIILKDEEEYEEEGEPYEL